MPRVLRVPASVAISVTGAASVDTDERTAAVYHLTLPDDQWWSFSSMMRCEKILPELESRGIATSREQ